MEISANRPDIQVNQRVFFTALGTTYKVLSNSVNGSAAIVEHTVEPKCIGAPMHKHTHEDEISYVLEGSFRLFKTATYKLLGPGNIS